ncbi:MAG: helix-turn-helix domain-containing protein [Polyangiaceae bacterium]
MADKLDRRTRKVLMALGGHLREVREQNQMQQTQLARVVGMEPTNLAKIERGQKNVTVDTLVRIAAGLGTGLKVELTKPPEGRHRSRTRGDE